MAGKFGNIFVNPPQWMEKIATAQTPEIVKKAAAAVQKLSTAAPTTPTTPNTQSVNNRPFQNLFPVGGRPGAPASSTDSIERGFNTQTQFGAMQNLVDKMQGRTRPTMDPMIAKAPGAKQSDDDIEIQLVNQRIDVVDGRVSAIEINMKRINDRLLRVESRLASMSSFNQIGERVDPILGMSNPTISFKFGASQFGGPPQMREEAGWFDGWFGKNKNNKSSGWFDWLWKNKGKVAAGAAVGGAAVAMGGDSIVKRQDGSVDDASQLIIKRDAITLRAKVLTIDADKVIWLKAKPDVVSATGRSSVATPSLERPEHKIDEPATTEGSRVGGFAQPNLGRLPQAGGGGSPSAGPSAAPSRARADRSSGQPAAPSAPSRPSQPSVNPMAMPDSDQATGVAQLPTVTKVSPSERNAQAQGSIELDSDPIKYAQKLAAAQGWTKEGTAALLGQVQQESNFNPYEIGDGGKSYGLFQMNNFGKSSGKEGRLDRLESILKRHTGLDDPLQYIRDVKAGRIKADPEITKKMIAGQFEHFTANDVDAKINTDRVKAGLQSKSIEGASQSIIGAIRPKNWLEQGTSGWDYQKRVGNANRIYGKLDIEGQRQPAASGQPANPNAPSRFVFNTDNTYTRGDIERMTQKNPGDKLLIGGNVENPGHDAAMKYAQERGHLTHDYLIGPGEPLKGYDGKGSAFPTDQAEIARITRQMGITREQWDKGGWKDYNFQKWKEANAKGRYSVEIDNFNNQSDEEALKTLHGWYGQMKEQNDGKQFNTRFMLKNASPAYMEQLEKQWQLHEKSGGKEGLPRQMFSDFGVAEQFMKPEDRAKAAEIAKRNGIVIGNTTRSDPRYQQYRTDDKGFENPANRRDSQSGNVARADSNAPMPKSMQEFEASIVDKSKQAGFGTQFGKLQGVDGLVVHHTSGRGTSDGVISTFQERNFPAQYIMERDGTIVRAIPEGYRGQHMRPGQGPMGEGKSNANMAGIEVIAKNNDDWTPAQKERMRQFAAWHAQKYGYDPKQGIVGHGDVNPHKQKDEGHTFVKPFREGKLSLYDFNKEGKAPIAVREDRSSKEESLAEIYKRKTGNAATLKPLMGDERETAAYQEWKKQLASGPPAAQVAPEEIVPKAAKAPETEDRLPGTIGQADGAAERRTQAKQEDDTQKIEKPTHDPEKEGKSPGSDGYASRDDEVLEI